MEIAKRFMRIYCYAAQATQVFFQPLYRMRRGRAIRI
jgi:hypothetical protein